MRERSGRELMRFYDSVARLVREWLDFSDYVSPAEHAMLIDRAVKEIES
jgi:hypothetical protein